jgi:hypothetical protein
MSDLEFVRANQLRSELDPVLEGIKIASTGHIERKIVSPISRNFKEVIDFWSNQLYAGEQRTLCVFEPGRGEKRSIQVSRRCYSQGENSVPSESVWFAYHIWGQNFAPEAIKLGELDRLSTRSNTFLEWGAIDLNSPGIIRTFLYATGAKGKITEVYQPTNELEILPKAVVDNLLRQGFPGIKNSNVLPQRIDVTASVNRLHNLFQEAIDSPDKLGQFDLSIAAILS